MKPEKLKKAFIARKNCTFKDLGCFKCPLFRKDTCPINSATDKRKKRR
jgi:hypothetical protein